MNFEIVTRLDAAAFAAALRHGRGAAPMHVQAYGLDGVKDAVLDACLANQAYDAQCEGSRAEWLHAMFKSSPYRPDFSSAIVTALSDDSDEHDYEQLCELAGSTARDGDMLAAEALREFVWQQDTAWETTQYGWHAIALLDGWPAIAELARRAGRILQAHPDEFVDSLEDLTEGQAAYSQALQELRRLAQDDTEIATYVMREQQLTADREVDSRATDEEKAARRQSYRDRFRLEWPVDAILASAKKHEKDSRHLYTRFTRFATSEDLEQILRHFVTESDLDACLHMLWAMQRTELPNVPLRLWEFAEHDDQRIRDAAVLALVGVVDPAVAELGRKRLRDSAFSAQESDVIELFTNNYRAGDEELILAALQKLLPTDDEAHALGSSALKLIEHNEMPAMRGIAEWVYMTNPCTLCRQSVVRWLIETDTMSAVVATECEHDADSDTRALATEWLARRPDDDQVRHRT